MVKVIITGHQRYAYVTLYQAEIYENSLEYQKGTTIFFINEYTANNQKYAEIKKENIIEDLAGEDWPSDELLKNLLFGY